MGREKAIEILARHYNPEGKAFNALVTHGDAIADKAKRLILGHPELTVDAELIEEAAYLHDIGILDTDAPDIGCHGPHPYLAHGILGKARLEREQLPQHARIAECHIGVGLTKTDIINHRLPLPPRDMVPETLEEQLLCFLDLFFSKTPGKMTQEKSKEKIRKKLYKRSPRHADVFDIWCEKFKE